MCEIANLHINPTQKKPPPLNKVKKKDHFPDLPRSSGIVDANDDRQFHFIVLAKNARINSSQRSELVQNFVRITYDWRIYGGGLEQAYTPLKSDKYTFSVTF